MEKKLSITRNFCQDTRIVDMLAMQGHFAYGLSDDGLYDDDFPMTVVSNNGLELVIY